MYAPRLQPVWLFTSLSVAVATAVLVGIYVGLYYGLVPADPPGTDPRTNRTLEIAKVAIALAGFVGAVLTGVYAYRKQRFAEGDARRADVDHLVSRFGWASEQLGHDNAAVRLAGVYAMAALADDWTAQRQLCINVLTAYLQVPYQPHEQTPGHRHGEREVRRNILRVIRDHLRDGFSDVSWCGYSFRFEGAVFDGGDLTGARFTAGNVTFHGGQVRRRDVPSR